MSIDELKQLIVPPAQPCEVGTLAQWRIIEDRLGTKLPCDFREFVFAYGSGLFARLYCVYNPFSSSEYVALIPQGVRVCDYNRESQKSFPLRFPYPYYPETGGLLPWGNDENGNDYFWLTEGPPDKWVVVQDNNRGEGIRLQPYSLTGFLVAILRQNVKPLASGYPRRDDYIFEPWNPGASG